MAKLILYFHNVALLHSGVEKNLINFKLHQQQNPHMKNLSVF